MPIKEASRVHHEDPAADNITAATIPPAGIKDHVLDAALAFATAGCCVIPAAADGSKAPLGAWKQWQEHRPTDTQLRGWLTAGHPGMGLVTGAVSGGLEMLEFEAAGISLIADVAELAAAAGLGEAWQRAIAGYMESTPSGGVHLLYRIDGAPVPANTKLAMGPGRKVLAETRGEGGFVIVAPSGGTVHPTGRPWQLASGSAATIPILTAAERDGLHAIIKSFGEQPEPPPVFAQPGRQHDDTGELKPGDDYNQKTDWARVLAGWKLVATRGTVRYWRRPGKDKGISATTGRPPHDNLYVFSTSTDFETETPISKFMAYAVLNHGGDTSAAARALRLAGYGAPRTAPAVTLSQSPLLRSGQQDAASADVTDTAAAQRAADPDAAIQMAVEQRKASLRIEAAAREQLAAENAPPVPPTISGADFLAQPDNPAAYRIASLMPVGSNVLLTAQAKAGKTTLTGNLVKTWCDGVPFLGAYDFEPVDGPVMVIDAEMSADTARRWLRAHDIRNPARFRYVNLRGAAAALNPLIPASRKEWAGIIRGCSAVLLDCLGPVLGAMGLDENSNPDVIRFFAGWDELLADAGVTESVIAHHMGHGGERARGASRLREWPDVEWRMMRQDDDPRSPRYFTAYGRDVDVPEIQLAHDADTRHLTAGHGSRKQVEATAIRAALADLLTTSPGLSGNQIESALAPDHIRGAVRAGIAAAAKAGDIEIKLGPRNSHCHYLTSPVRRTSPPRTGEVTHQCSPPFIGGELARSPASTETETENGELKSRPETPLGVQRACPNPDCSGPLIDGEPHTCWIAS